MGRRARVRAQGGYTRLAYGGVRGEVFLIHRKVRGKGGLAKNDRDECF